MNKLEEFFKKFDENSDKIVKEKKELHEIFIGKDQMNMYMSTLNFSQALNEVLSEIIQNKGEINTKILLEASLKKLNDLDKDYLLSQEWSIILLPMIVTIFINAAAAGIDTGKNLLVKQVILDAELSSQIRILMGKYFQSRGFKILWGPAYKPKIEIAH